MGRVTRHGLRSVQRDGSGARCGQHEEARDAKTGVMMGREALGASRPAAP